MNADQSRKSNRTPYSELQLSVQVLQRSGEVLVIAVDPSRPLAVIRRQILATIQPEHLSGPIAQTLRLLETEPKLTIKKACERTGNTYGVLQGRRTRQCKGRAEG